MFEDLPSRESRVLFDPERPDLPAVHYSGPSGYARRGIDEVPAMVDVLARALPIEDVIVREGPDTAAHIQGTTPMGDDPDSSVIDRHLIHHRVRNLVVLGSGAFPSCPPANPTLTLAALSLWSARHLLA